MGRSTMGWALVGVVAALGCSSSASDAADSASSAAETDTAQAPDTGLQDTHPGGTAQDVASTETAAGDTATDDTAAPDSSSSGATDSAACTTTVVEAEDMAVGGPVANQIPTDGGITIRAEGDYLSTAHGFAGETTIQVVARGTFAGGAWPVMQLRVGDTAVGTAEVASSSYDHYVFAVPAGIAGDNEVRIVFTNDYFDGTADRNLDVDKIRIGCDTAPPACVDGATRWGSTPCGTDQVYLQRCVDGQWEDTATCVGGGTVTGVPVIFETDWQFDVDDVGALAVLHGLQNEGKCTILGVSYNEVDPNGPGAIDAVNTWYHRGDIPIGYYDGALANPDGDRYNWELNHDFPHTMDDNFTGPSVEMYKNVLAHQPDDSVVVVSVGFLNNLYDLLQDAQGYALVASKVKLLAVMGGLHNDDFNFTRHGLVDQTQYVIANWPGTLVTTHHGAEFETGPAWNAANPVARAYQLWGGTNGYQRASWDPVTALYAVVGAGSLFFEDWSGDGSLTNGYQWTLTASGPRPRGFAGCSDFGACEAEIERLMNLPPQ